MLLRIKQTSKQKSDKSEEKYGFKQNVQWGILYKNIFKKFLSGKAFSSLLVCSEYLPDLAVQGSVFSCEFHFAWL